MQDTLIATITSTNILMVKSVNTNMQKKKHIVRVINHSNRDRTVCKLRSKHLKGNDFQIFKEKRTKVCFR